MPLIRSASYNLLVEILLRVALFISFWYMEELTPFQRVIQPSELQSELRYPHKDSYVTGATLWSLVLSVPCLLSMAACLLLNDCNDACQILLTWSLAVSLTGCMTNGVKLLVGRPRPDFFYRCFPDGVDRGSLNCTGDISTINDGRKSFPSGHSSLSFSSMGVLSLWFSGRASGRARGSTLVLRLAPLAIAGCVAISRTCDYHHHWQDVLVGSFLGYGIALLCYNQYYNPISSPLSGIPYVVSSVATAKIVNGLPQSPSTEKKESGYESTPLINNVKKDDKWI